MIEIVEKKLQNVCVIMITPDSQEEIDLIKTVKKTARKVTPFDSGDFVKADKTPFDDCEQINLFSSKPEKEIEKKPEKKEKPIFKLNL